MHMRDLWKVCGEGQRRKRLYNGQNTLSKNAISLVKRSL